MIATNFIYNIKDTSGKTPLHKASARGHDKIVELLVKNGANVNAMSSSLHETPLMYAAERGREKIVEFLIKNGAQVFYEGMH